MFEYTAIIPALNEASCIRGAIESVLHQSLPPREVIVVDDGSSDGTRDVAKRFAEVRVIRFGDIRGPSAARNAGILEARGPWVAFLDADDRWDPQKIRQQAEVAESTGAGLIYCGVRVVRDKVDKPVQVYAETFKNQRAVQRQLLLRNCVTGSGSAVLVRKVLLEKAGGFDIGLGVSEDRDMWLRLSQLTTFAAVRQPLVTLWARSGSWGGDPNRMFEGGLAVLRKNAHMLSSFRDGRVLRRRAEARLYERRGIAYLMRGDLSLARSDLLKATRIWPFRLHSLVPLFKLVAGILRS